MNFRLIVASLIIGSSSLLLSHTTAVDSPKKHAECLHSQRPFIILYSDPVMCPPCKRLHPVFKQVAESYTDISFYTVNANDSALDTVFKDMSVQRIPTLVFGYNNKVLMRSVGELSKAELQNKIASFKAQLSKLT